MRGKIMKKLIILILLLTPSALAGDKVSDIYAPACQGLSGIKIYLYNSKDSTSKIDSATTDINGFYTFTPTSTGNYRVKEASNSQWIKQFDFIETKGDTAFFDNDVEFKTTPFTDVRWYGAIGDGLTNNNVALQAALDASLNVYIPPGTYITSAILTYRSNHKIFGAGRLLTIIKNTTTNGMARQGSGNVNNVTLRDFQIQTSNGATGQIAFDFTRTSYSEFSNLIAQFDSIGFKFSRDSVAGQCYFNVSRDLYCLRNKTGILLDDVFTGTTPNSNTFFNTFIEDVGVWETNQIGIDHSGFGNSFFKVYAGEMDTVAIKLRATSGNALFCQVYAESSPLSIDASSIVGSPNRTNTIIGLHHDGSSLISDPNNKLVILATDVAMAKLLKVQVSDSFLVKSGVNGQTDSAVIITASQTIDSILVSNSRVSAGALILITPLKKPTGVLYITSRAAGSFYIASTANEAADLPIVYYITKF